MDVGVEVIRTAPHVIAGEAQGRADDALVQALARGEADALEALYDRYHRALYAMAHHLLADPGAAEEVVQECFVKLWRRPEAYQPSRGRVLPWLLSVAHHHAVDLLRRRRLEQRLRAPEQRENDDDGDAVEQVPSAEDDPGARAGAKEQQALVAGVLRELPMPQRVPIELAYYRGLTQVEIAEMLHEPLGTIKTRMRLGLLRLRQHPSLLREWELR